MKADTTIKVDTADFDKQLEHLKATRRRLALSVLDGNQQAEAEMGEIEVTIAELHREGELRGLAAEQRRLDEEEARRREAAELKKYQERQMRRLAKKRMELNREVEQLVGTLAEISDQHIQLGSEMWSLAQNLGGEGRHYDSCTSLINYFMYQLKPLFPYDLSLPYEAARRPLTEIEAGKLSDWIRSEDEK
jgi:hypothetical protein